MYNVRLCRFFLKLIETQFRFMSFIRQENYYRNIIIVIISLPITIIFYIFEYKTSETNIILMLKYDF